MRDGLKLTEETTSADKGTAQINAKSGKIIGFIKTPPFLLGLQSTGLFPIYQKKPTNTTPFPGAVFRTVVPPRRRGIPLNAVKPARPSILLTHTRKYHIIKNIWDISYSF